MHVPQSITTANELIELAAVTNQIISVRECKPIISVVQDVALGVYRLTKSSVQLSQKQLFNLMANNIKFTSYIPEPDKNNKWTGRQLMSTIIPKNINIKTPNKSYEGKDNDTENYVVIQNGELVQGVLDKLVYQNRTKGLIHSIYNECSPHETRIFFDNTQKLICDWLVLSGFSVGISDLIIDDITITNLKKEINTMKVNVYDMIKNIHNGQFENKSISSNSEYFETEVNKVLNQTVNQIGKMALSKINDLDNRMINMVKSGSKGSIINVSQMIACLGQQNVDGKRISYGFDDRTLPHYNKYDDGPESRGFVENSFMTGLSPQEFFFHAMGGREGLIDTAVKSVTGDTFILIIEDGRSKYIKIGEWIDYHMDGKRKGDVKHYPEDRNMEYLELDTKVYIPTCNEDGDTSWGELTAITRHDPSETLYKFTTQSGRSVTVADSESMIVWDNTYKVFEKKESKDIKIDDIVPVIASISRPPIINQYVDMSDYFPKSKYVYGTECYKAIEEIKKAKGTKKCLPNSWWKNNNGKLFTVPYKRSGYLENAVNRETIKEDCVYLNSCRANYNIPDKFELNYENGIFIGLYLAEGSTRNPRQVSIANTDRKIKDFVIKWFNKYNIHNLEENYECIDETTNKKKISENIVGNSTLLASFVDMTMGHGAKNKHVPDFAYNAPEEFILGLLNGYFSGDGHVDKYGGFSGTSISVKLLEGIALLCNQIGVFGRIITIQRKKNGEKVNTEYKFQVNAQWANKFSEKVEFILDYKNEKLKKIKNTRSHMNYDQYNDIATDKIIKIEPILSHSETKLYDVTVPSTLNFNVSSGLIIRDTSETGYIQRKLVKAMEDCKINYDYTVRNASGSIIQFLYGEDGMDATKIESQPLLYIDMDYVKLRNEYLITKDDDFKYLLDEKEEKIKDQDYKDLEEHFKQILKDREFMISEIFGNKKETTIMYPVSFMRIINNAKALYNEHDKGVLLDITPRYILDTINNLCDELYINKNNKGNKFIQILIRCYLSPKKVIVDYRLGKMAFENIIQQVKYKFYDAIAHPSEMVGVIAAQSIGEPATQMSAVRETIIRVTGKNNFTYSGTIGDFIDKLLNDNKNKVISIGQDSVVLDLDETYNIIGVSNDEKTSWRRISQVSRHPANGNLVTVKTRSGKTTTATLTHSFLKRTEKGIEPIKGSELKIGDRIPVARNIKEVKDPQMVYEIGGEYYPLNKDLGWLCGVYIADGNINTNTINITKCIPEYNEKLKNIVYLYFGCDIIQKHGEGGYFEKYDKRYPNVENYFNHKELAQFLGDEFGRGSENKYIPAWVYGCNKEFISGIIQGYFDGDGNVATGKGKGMIRAGSISEKLICDMIVLLAYFGMFASKCLEWSKTGKEKKKFHTIQISRKYAQLYKDTIGFTVKTKAEGLDKVIDYVNRPDKLGHDQEYIDKIPCIINLLSKIKDELNCKISINKESDSIGRVTVEKKLKYFEEVNVIKKSKKAQEYIELLRNAVYSDVVWDEIIELEYLEDPKEYVYDFTVPGNDSFMVDTCILVHNTLNSVEWNTEILLDDDGLLTRVKIGEFIDNLLKNNKNIENHPNDTKLGWIKDKNIKVLSCNENGKITWNLVEAVTQHPPINEDGSNTLLKIITKSGREVTATKAKSFLKRIDNKIQPVRGDELNIGDFVPVSNILPINKELNEWDISIYLSKNEYVFMSEVKKAIDIYNEYSQKNKRHWFKKNNGKLFTIPYTRSDGFIDAFIGVGKNKGKGRRCNIIKSQENCVYPKNTIYQPADIPEKLPLDELTGFFMGAYLSEGSCTDYHILIANVDNKFNNKIDDFCNRYNLHYHIDEKITEKGHSKTLRIHSKVLTQLLLNTFDTGSINKRIPSELFAGSLEFIKGLIDGYISGDGSVDKKINTLSATSISHGLMEDIQQLLTKFGIQTTITTCDSALEYALNNGMNAHLAYKLQLNAQNTYKFKQIFNITLESKQERLDKRCEACNISKIDIIPDIITKEFGVKSISRYNIQSYIDKCTNEEDINILKNVLEEDIIYDEIIDIIEIKSEYPYVYDLTVENTRNFNIYNGLCIRDTFHLSGVSSASKAVRGVPRIKELLSVTRNIKSPSMTIYLNKSINDDKMKSKEVLNSIETTYFKDIVSSTKIYYDPNDFKTTIEDDKLFIDSYKEFIITTKEDIDENSPWLLRLEFDKQKLLEYSISMIDIYHVLNDFYDEAVSLKFSDDNAQKLIFRIKLKNETDKKDMITDLKALEKNIMEGLIIKGVKKINKVSMSKKEEFQYNEETMGFDKNYEWVLETNGSNLLDIMCHKLIDNKRTVSNNINEIYELLGIEAARLALYNEISDVIKDADLFVNYRHLALLVDTMTNKGYLLSIDRHGINRVDIGPLAKSSFEETTDMLIKAGIFSEIDKINGVSANIMLGQIPACGTGDSEILLDELKLTELDCEKQEEIDINDLIKEDICNLDNLTFDFELPDIDKSIKKKEVQLIF